MRGDVKRKIVKTDDGSTTIHLEEWNEQYHSKHGAIQEAYHVFIQNGLFQIHRKQVAILEMGFGTGLNALITLIEASKKSLQIAYTGVEKFPVQSEELAQLNFTEALSEPLYRESFEIMHQSPWDTPTNISPSFLLTKQRQDFERITAVESYDLIYFDAFGARVQPHLWTEAIFMKMFNALLPGGILVTYAAKGSVRRAMQAVGFTVERLPGPPGKREMLRALKKGPSIP